MKKVRIFSIVLLLISAGAFVAFRQYRKMTDDTVPPVLTCESEELVLQTDAAEEDLLQGVTAVDNRDGDVSGTLVVESISSFDDEGCRIVTYAAVDASNNVGRCQRTLVYEGYQPPEFHLKAPLSFAAGDTVKILSCITASGSLDGDLTDRIKYSLEGTVNSMVPGNYPVEFRVMDSGGNTVYLNTQIEVYERTYTGIKVSLKEYLVYLDKGQSFDPYAYYNGADAEGELSIESNVNTEEEGSYYVDYVVNGFGGKGKNRLIVVVR